MIIEIVAIYSSTTFIPVFFGANPIKATIKETSKIMDHPKESGAVFSDFRIINPIEIEIPMLISGDIEGFSINVEVYAFIKQIYLDGDFLTVQTKSGIYPNMVIESMPHEESPEKFNAFTMPMKFREVQEVNASFGTLPPSSVKNKSNSSTVLKGEASPVDIPNSIAGNILGTD